MSTIKQKTGICPECDGDKIVPLISGRCSGHYWQYRKRVNEAKKTGEKPTQKPKANKVIKRQKPIPKRSKKEIVRLAKYNVARIEFLGKPENRICPITGDPATEIHHKKGRVGDLLLDTRFFLAVSREGHRKIEENPAWAKENGFSLDRLSN